jgi:hypothetical protein
MQLAILVLHRPRTLTPKGNPDSMSDVSFQSSQHPLLDQLLSGHVQIRYLDIKKKVSKFLFPRWF